MLCPFSIVGLNFYIFDMPTNTLTLVIISVFTAIFAGLTLLANISELLPQGDNTDDHTDVPVFEPKMITYYTINHPKWERSRLVNHDYWEESEGKIIGTCKNAWIQLPSKGAHALEFYAEVFGQDGEDFIVKLNGEPLVPEERSVWQHLNPDPLGRTFHVGEFEIQRHDCNERDLPMTIIGPDIEGEHILQDIGGYPNSIGSGETCGIRLPDTKLPEFMAEIVPMSNHRMLYALHGNQSAGQRPPEGEFIRRVDLYHFELAGYLIFQRRDPNNRVQKSAALAFRKANGML